MVGAQPSVPGVEFVLQYAFNSDARLSEHGNLAICFPSRVGHQSPEHEAHRTRRYAIALDNDIEDTVHVVIPGQK